MGIFVDKIGPLLLGTAVMGYMVHDSIQGVHEIDKMAALAPPPAHVVKPKPKEQPKEQSKPPVQQQPKQDDPAPVDNPGKPDGCTIQAEDGSWVNCGFYNTKPKHKKKKKRKRKTHYYNLDRGYSMDQEDASVREFGDHSKAYVDTGNDDHLPYVIMDTWNFDTTKKSWQDYANK